MWKHSKYLELASIRIKVQLLNFLSNLSISDFEADVDTEEMHTYSFVENLCVSY